MKLDLDAKTVEVVIEREPREARRCAKWGALVIDWLGEARLSAVVRRLGLTFDETAF